MATGKMEMGNKILNKLKLGLVGLVLAGGLNAHSQANRELDSSYASRTIKKIYEVKKELSQFGQIDETYQGNSAYFIIFLPQYHGYMTDLRNETIKVQTELLGIYEMLYKNNISKTIMAEGENFSLEEINFKNNEQMKDIKAMKSQNAYYFKEKCREISKEEPTEVYISCMLNFALLTDDKNLIGAYGADHYFKYLKDTSIHLFGAEDSSSLDYIYFLANFQEDLSKRQSNAQSNELINKEEAFKIGENSDKYSRYKWNKSFIDILYSKQNTLKVSELDYLINHSIGVFNDSRQLDALNSARTIYDNFYFKNIIVQYGSGHMYSSYGIKTFQQMCKEKGISYAVIKPNSVDKDIYNPLKKLFEQLVKDGPFK